MSAEPAATPSGRLVVSAPYGLAHGNDYAVFTSGARAFAYRLLDSPFALLPLMPMSAALLDPVLPHQVTWVVVGSFVVALVVAQAATRIFWAPLVRAGRVVPEADVRDVLGSGVDGGDVVARLVCRKLDPTQMSSLAEAVLAVPAITAGNRSGLLAAKAKVRRLVTEADRLSSSR